MRDIVKLEWLPRGWCFECGNTHAPDRRHAILRRMLPSSVHEIREEYSCLWGSPDQDDAGARMLYRDLHTIGAVRHVGAVWHLEQIRRAA